MNKEEFVVQVTSDPQGNHSFIRKGQLNGWKNEMSLELVKKLDAWLHENLKDNPLGKYCR